MSNKNIFKKNIQKDNSINSKEKNLQNDIINKSKEDSSDISDYNENDSIGDAFDYDKNKENSESVDEKTKQEYIKTVVYDRILKYLKIDDVIKKKNEEFREEMKTIKQLKDKLERFLIDYLDKIEQEYIQIETKQTTLTKTEVKSKAPIKKEDISISLIEGFKKYEIYDNDDEIKRVVTDFIETIENKREIKTRKYLKRTKIKKEKKCNKKDKTK